MMTTNNLGLYIHIPFCARKCKYCDFISFEGYEESLKDHYVRELIRDIEDVGLLYGKSFHIDTIFFGGGTPSILSEERIEEILYAVHRNFCVTPNAEITLEANPGTLNAAKIKTYRSAGVNRLSLGVQVLDDHLLNRLGRIHTVQDFLKNYEMARNAGFDNINLDLMFAIPEQTPENWRDTLERAIRLAPEHISFYSLQIEENTDFYEMLRKGEIQQAPDQIDRDMYHSAIEILSGAGYRHYEISNASKPGFECRHNLKYWSMENYLGLGLGAHSFIEGTRSSITEDLSEYLHGERIKWRHRNTLQDDISEYIFTGMRKSKGIDLADFKRNFGKDIFEFYPDQKPLVDQYIQQGLVVIRDGQMTFTVAGFDISNTILAEFV